MFALLLSLHTLAAPTPVAPTRYKLVNKSTVDLGMAGMAPIAITMSAFVTITMTDSAAGRTAHVVIDSSTFDAGEMGAAMAGSGMGDSPKGVTLHAYLINGKLQHPVMPSTMNLQAMQLAPAIQLLLIGTRAAKPGESWVDSTVADTAVSAMTTRASMITEWKASSAANGGLQLDGTVTGTTTVGGGQMQMDMQMSGASHIMTHAGEMPTAAAANTNGSGSMNLGGQTMTMKLAIEVSATLIP